MYENNIGSIIIVKNKDRNNDVNKPVGIITERDIVRILGLQQQPALLKVPVYKLMTKPLITISPNNSIKDALQTMQLKNSQRLPIVQNEGSDNMVGIISDKDLFRAIMRNQNLISSLLTNQLLTEHKAVYEQFSEYWFGDILHKL